MTITGYLKGTHQNTFLKKAQKRKVIGVNISVRQGWLDKRQYYVALEELYRINGRPAVIPDILRADDGVWTWNYSDAMGMALTTAEYFSRDRFKVMVNRRSIPEEKHRLYDLINLKEYLKNGGSLTDATR